MATKVELLTAFKSAIKPDVAKFSQADANSAAINAILETYNLKDASTREILARQPEVFAIVEQAIEELLPAAITDIMGGYAEVQTFARDAEPLFTIKKVGKARARLSIVEGARGGIYRARRLDNKNMTVPVKVMTVGTFVTLEEILLGTLSLAELMDNIAQGFVEQIYIKTVEAMRTAKTLAPAANIKSGNGVVAADLDALIRIAAAYGDPIIMGFRSAVANINNQTGWTGVTPNVAQADVDEIRKQGFVGLFHGTPVVELPNYLIDETNSGFVFKEGDLFILPTAAKPVKIAMKGDLHIEETAHPSGSREQNAHRLVGVGLMLANNVCVYTDTSITGGKY